MQAVRLSRHHIRRYPLLRFYGWWDDVQPGPGKPAEPHETYTLKERGEAPQPVLRSRRDIALVLVNPLQAPQPNRGAPSDSALLSGFKPASFGCAAHTRWLQQLRQVCKERGIVLSYAEVFMGFRLAAGRAQAYFGVKADLVTYGKTLGGALPGFRGAMRSSSKLQPAGAGVRA